MTKLEHALTLAKRGFRVFPVRENAKAPPLLNDWPNKATTDPETIKQFWLAVPNANIAIECSGMIVVDVDVAKGGEDSFQLLGLKYGWPDTLATSTPSGGRHCFFRHPDPVSNSVGALGAGIDVRSAGGYVVAPGSTTDRGVYDFVSGSRDIAPAPAWLVDRLGTPAPERASTGQPVLDATAEVVARAKDWLAGQLPAIEGFGGDAHTFKVVAGLRDMGVSADQALELLPAWNQFCSPPWSPDELGVKVVNAYKYGQNEPGVRAVLAEDFPVVDTLKGINSMPVDTLKGMAALRLSQFANSEHKGPGYLVKGILNRRTYAELFGAPGEGKTFVALDLAYHVAGAKPWMGRKVHAGPVLYLAYEGIGGLVKRAQALRQHYGGADVPLYVTGAAYDLRSLPGRQQLGQVIAGLPEKPILIVVDTFARALMGGDENSAQDVGAFNSAVAALIENTGACVLIVHHSGKNKNAGARGSSALLGAIDTELEVDNGQVTSRKQRDVEIGEPIGFTLKGVSVGMDEDGDLLTSCVVVAGTVAASSPTGRLTGNPKRGFEILCDLAPDNKPVSEHAWRDGCMEFLGNKDVSKRFYDIKKALVRKGYVVEGTDRTVTRSIE